MHFPTAQLKRDHTEVESLLVGQACAGNGSVGKIGAAVHNFITDDSA